MDLVTVISSEFDAVKRRVVKFLRLGKKDVQTSLEASLSGVDSNPIKGMIAIYAETGEKGKTVIIGYLNKDKLAAVGEVRLFSTDADGALQFYTWLKNDGTYEIGGDVDNMVRFSKLEEGFNQLKDDVNDFISKFNSHVHATAAVGPPVIPTGTPVSSSDASIADSKIDEIKTL